MNPKVSPGRRKESARHAFKDVDRMITIQYAGNCVGCGRWMKVGEQAMWQKGEGVLCLDCKE